MDTCRLCLNSRVAIPYHGTFPKLIFGNEFNGVVVAVAIVIANKSSLIVVKQAANTLKSTIGLSITSCQHIIRGLVDHVNM